MNSRVSHKNGIPLEPLYVLSGIVGVLSIVISVFGTSYLLKNIEFFLGGITLLIALGMFSVIWSLRDRTNRALSRLQNERLMFMQLFHDTLERSATEMLRVKFKSPEGKLATASFEGVKEKVDEFTQLYSYDKNIALLGMRRIDPRQNENYQVLKDAVRRVGFRLFRTSDEQVAPDVLSNVIVLLLGCKYGIAVFDLDRTGASAQNVAFELGLMCSMGKEVLVLKNAEVASVPIDLLQYVYYEYRDISEVKEIVGKWIHERSVTDVKNALHEDSVAIAR